ncbi:hypothetical protein [Absidia glauca]|uniref:Serine/threonine-protein phosphatase 4 regulatory subunit 3-like central domain-containing protein n=1 Tax=Absidia glauca TaxID=4829 RepID=A0A168SYE7_ABSGL|nr:hypothetical protein [Absidia glauca]
MSMPNNTFNSSLLPHRAKVHIAKVYSLDEVTGIWVLKGTGAFVYLECDRGDIDEFFVVSQTDGSFLVRSFVSRDSRYNRHAATQVSWHHTDGPIVLQFVRGEARDDVWRCISEKQGADLNYNGPAGFTSDRYANSVIPNEQILPTPTMENLDYIITKLEDTSTPDKKNKLTALIIGEDYVDKMFDIFEECKRLNKINHLLRLFTIMKSIFLLHDIDVIRYLVNRANIRLVIAILEYDPATPTTKANYLGILEERLRKKSAALLEDQPIVTHVLQAYRIEYLNNILMEQRYDGTLSFLLRSQIPYEHIAALHWYQNDIGHLEKIFENITCANPLPASSRLKLYRKLVSHGLFTVIEIAISSDDSSLRTAGAAALCCIEDLAAPLLDSHVSSLQRQGDANDDNARNNRRDSLLGVINNFFKTTDPDFNCADGSPPIPSPQIKQEDDGALTMIKQEDDDSPPMAPQQTKHKRVHDDDDDDDTSARHAKHRRLSNDSDKERSERQNVQRAQQLTISRLETLMKKNQQQRTPTSPTSPVATSSTHASPSFGSHSMCTRQQQRQQQQRQQQQQQERPFDERINRLETNEAQSSHVLQQSMVDTAKRLDALERSIARQAHEDTTSQRQLEQQISQVLNHLSTLTQQSNNRA